MVLYKLLSERLAFQLVTVSFDVDDPAVVEQPVQDRRGDDLATEQLLPIDKALVQCDDGGGLLVTGRHELEEEIGLIGIHRKIPHLINDNETRGDIRLHPGLALLEPGDKTVHGGAEDLEAVRACLDGENDGEMRFSVMRSFA